MISSNVSFQRILNSGSGNCTQQHYRHLDPTNVPNNGIVVALIPATFCSLGVAGDVLLYLAQLYKKELLFYNGERGESSPESFSLAERTVVVLTVCTVGNNSGEMTFLFSPVFLSCFFLCKFQKKERGGYASENE